VQVNSFLKVISTSVAIFVSALALPAGAVTLDVFGSAGIDGVNGGAGGDANAITPPNSDPSNTANATGGTGATGGQGGSANAVAATSAADGAAKRNGPSWCRGRKSGYYQYGTVDPCRSYRTICLRPRVAL
jgi:hypothetical protein